MSRLINTQRRSVALKRIPCLVQQLRGVHTWASDEGQEVRADVHEKQEAAAPDFEDYVSAYNGHSTREILSSLAILRLCRSQSLVQNADALLETSRSLLGDAITYGAIKRSFFKQFCPGSGREEALSKMQFLASHGIGCIFDWVPVREPSLHQSKEQFQLDVDTNMKTIIGGIECAAMDEATRMTAVKLATLTDMDMLKNVSSVIQQLAESSNKDHWSLLHEFDTHLSRNNSPSAPENLSATHRQELEDLKDRLTSLSSIAAQKNVRLLIDAEETEIEPAINYVVLSVMERVNRDSAWVWNTYQCYLKNASARMAHDMDYLLSKGCAVGVKLVRGAYLNHERELAMKTNRPSEVFDTQQETDLCYNSCMKTLIDGIHAGKKIEVCLATHNQTSIQTALAYMDALKMDRSAAPVYFAQIYGMRDFLTFTLGHHHYKAAKLLVFGDVHHIIPFLIRRAQENAAVLGGSQHDIDAMKNVLRSRLSHLIERPLDASHGV